MDTELNRKLMDWITGNDTGLSSVTLWSIIKDGGSHNPSVPLDTDDFGRCYRFLKLCDTETKYNTLLKTAKKYPMWRLFELNWRKMEKLYENNNIEELNKILKEIRPY